MARAITPARMILAQVVIYFWYFYIKAPTSDFIAHSVAAARQCAAIQCAAIQSKRMLLRDQRQRSAACAPAVVVAAAAAAAIVAAAASLAAAVVAAAVVFFGWCRDLRNIY